MAIRCGVADAAVALAAVVEDLDVLEDRVLHRGPEQFHHRVVEAVADGPERGHEPRGADLVAEGPGGELSSVVGVNDSAGLRVAVHQRHVEGIDDQPGVGAGVDGLGRVS